MSSDRQTLVESAAARNLNGSANTVLKTLRVMQPMRIHRFGVVADAAAGLKAAMKLKLRRIPVETGTAADITGAVLNGAAKARGFGIVKTLDTRETVLDIGDEIVIAIDTAAGATSTGDVFIEYEPLPFQVYSVPNMVEESS